MTDTSIIMTSYNYADHIKSAIGSIIDQSYQDWELIVVDDGSTDNSIEIIKSFIDKHPDKIKLLTHPNNANKGIKETNELALANVKGEYVAFLESDDIWKPDCLEKKVSALKNFPDAVLAFSDIELLVDDGFDAERHYNYLKYSRYIGKKCSRKPKDLSKMILFRNPVISFSNIVIRKSVLTDLNFIKEHEIWSDWQLVIHAASQGKFVYVDEKLLYWRLHKKSQNFAYMKSDAIDKNEDFKRKVSIISNRSNIKRANSIPFYPFHLDTLLYKALHDLRFSFNYPKVAISELKRIIGS
jgi:glycosyltransferase involved in cell wall biosynthesis